MSANNLFENNASTVLASPVSSTDTEITVSDASDFPPIGQNQYCFLTLNGANGTEIVKCTKITGNLLTVIRDWPAVVSGGVPAGEVFAVSESCEMRITKELLSGVYDDSRRYYKANQLLGIWK